MKYEIERKAPGDAGYIKIAEKNAQTGSILTNHSYQIIDTLNDITPGTISYRIRQIVDTAVSAFTATYIDTAETYLNTPCTNDTTNIISIVKIAPNPTNSNASLIIETDYPVSNMSIAIYDMKGSLVTKLNHSKAAGKITFNLPVATLSKGKYIVKVFNGTTAIGTTTLLKL
jgi:hypothetical protein